MSLTDKFYGIVDGYYSGSDDFRLIEQVLQEVDRFKDSEHDELLIGRLEEIIENDGKK